MPELVYREVKAEAIRQDKPMWRVANEAGMPEHRLRGILRGRIVPTEADKERLAAVLGQPVHVLFSKDSPALTRLAVPEDGPLLNRSHWE